MVALDHGSQRSPEYMGTHFELLGRTDPGLLVVARSILPARARKKKPLKNQGLSLIQLPGNATGRQSRDHSHSVVAEPTSPLNSNRIFAMRMNRYHQKYHQTELPRFCGL